MKLFAIHAPRDEALSRPESARAERTGFAFWALVFGPLWLLARGLWLALLVYVALAAAVIAAERAGLLREGAAAALFALGHLYLAVEGRALALAARRQAGRAVIDLVYARSLLEAEKIHLDRALAAGGAHAPPAAPGEVIGLFPEPGR